MKRLLTRARAAGVSRALVILAAEDDAEIARADTVLSAWPECRFAVGVHPHHAKVFASNPQAAADTVAARLDALPACRAIGEIGLDYHYDFSPREVQHDVFRVQIRLALERDLPIVIHTREAEDDTLRIIREEGQGRLRGVFHCFTGDQAAAERALATGFLLSIPGVATFPKAEDASPGGRRRAGRSPAGRNRQPVPGTDSVSGQAQRAVLRRESGRAARRGPRHDGGGRRRANRSQLRAPVPAVRIAQSFVVQSINRLLCVDTARSGMV